MNNLTKRYILRFIIALAAVTALAGIAAYYYVSKSVANRLTLPHTIIGKKVTLKQLTDADFVDYHNMFSSTVRKDLEFPELITLDYTIQYLHYEMQQVARGAMIMYCIFDNHDKKLIGSIEIRDKNDQDPGQLGAWINEAYWGQGRYQEALALITKMYFKLKPHEKSYSIHTRLWNKRSYYAHKKYGMKDRGYFYENGKPARYILECQRP